MDFQSLVTVGNYEFPEPATYSGNTSTLVDSGRNTNGVVIGSVIRDDVAKVELSWKYLTVEDWSKVLSCFNPTSGGNFYNYVTFFNQSTGDFAKRKMYVSDRSAGLWRRNSKTGKVMGWTNCKLNLIEV
jgi:hypothetical protein